MQNSTPSDQEWKELYEAAIEFRKINCWNWMDDSELFGVQDPVSGEIAYCCVMGSLGEVFGLNGYLGLEGLEGYLRLQSSGKRLIDQVDAFLCQKSISVTFENKSDLQKKDKDVIKRLGLSFKGEKAWPLFRSYKPGYFPWFLNKEEVVFLNIILRQAKEVALNFKESWHLINPPFRDCLLVRTPEGKGGNLIWRDKWVKFPSPRRLELMSLPLDEIRLMKIKKTYPKKPGIWEIDLFYAYMPVKEGEERPYYPTMFLYVDHNTGLIINADVSSPKDYQLNFQNSFLNLIEEIKLLPQELMVKREEVYLLLEPIASYLGIPLVMVKSLLALEEVKKAMFESFTARKNFKAR